MSILKYWEVDLSRCDASANLQINRHRKKECIPVGCVPTDCWQYPIDSLPGGGSALPVGGLPYLEVGRPPSRQMRPPLRLPLWTDACENITFPILRMRAVETLFKQVKIGNVTNWRCILIVENSRVLRRVFSMDKLLSLKCPKMNISSTQLCNELMCLEYNCW